MSIALLDQLESGVDHKRDYPGRRSSRAKKQFHIGPLKNKGQLIARHRENRRAGDG